MRVNEMTKRSRSAGRIAAICILTMAVGAAAAQQPGSGRAVRGEEVMRGLNAGAPQPALETLRSEFPFLAEAISAYALDDVWGRTGLDPRTRQIATVAAFAATGQRSVLKIHAGYALNLGVTREELKEVVYLTTVHAGFPRAIEAAQTLTELFKERDQERTGVN